MTLGPSGPPLAPMNKGFSRRERVRANRNISFDCLAGRCDDGHGAGLLALAGDRQNVARANRRLGALDRQGFRNAQASAIEQAQNGGIPRDDPVRPVFSGPSVHANHLAGRIDAQWLWQAALDPWRAQRREGERLTLAIAFKIAGEGAQARELAQERPAARAKAPPRRQKGAQIPRREDSRMRRETQARRNAPPRNAKIAADRARMRPPYVAKRGARP